MKPPKQCSTCVFADVDEDEDCLICTKHNNQTVDDDDVCEDYKLSKSIASDYKAGCYD